jgi:hypothetical protein
VSVLSGYDLRIEGGTEWMGEEGRDEDDDLDKVCAGVGELWKNTEDP